MHQGMIRTARLVLRPPDERDVPQLVEGCSDPGVPRYIPMIPVPYGEEDARAWLAGDRERWDELRECAFAITTHDDDELLGVISVRLIEGGSIGYWLRPRARGRGVMAEALQGIVEWAREEHGLHGLFLTTHPDNVASQRVAERAGFVCVGPVEHLPPFADGRTDALRFEPPGR
jgi:RimJ/RimL family protein N-acetyltransferase